MTYLMSSEPSNPKDLSLSDRPFAHCCQNFREQNFLVAVFLIGKSNRKLSNFFISFSRCKDIITKFVSVCQAFFENLFFRFSLTFLTTLILKHIFLSLSSVFLHSKQAACFTALLSTAKCKSFVHFLIVQGSHGRLGPEG